ncbi:MAG: ABC transporter permease [Verrucomicrobia bacterium]|jgi:putative ABC transport system permease protein|nr:ABC transporter permease [Verrucomicrobiota bacterium]
MTPAARNHRRAALQIVLAELRESLFMALDAIRAHKLRSSLTLLGVLIGVFSIIAVMTALRVMQRNVERELSQLGAHSFMAHKFPAMMFQGRPNWWAYRQRKDITYAMANEVVRRATLPTAVGIEAVFWGGQVESRFASTAPNVQLYGETPGSFPVRNWTVAEGRSLNDSDVEDSRDVTVIGASLARTVFPFGDALGQSLKLNGIHYTVIGVLESRGGGAESDQENIAIVPLTTGLDRFGRWHRSLNVLVQADGADRYEDTVDEVTGILRVLRKVPPGADNDFEITSNDSLIAQFNQFTRAVRLGVAVVSSIALLAAGIGIMNIMLVSVTERTREIGVRRAVGAKKRNVMTQFIAEAVVLCQVGGLIGVALGLIGGNVAGVLLKLPLVLPLDWVVLGLVICSVVGVVFGTYPAWRAANLDPVESLRYE